MLLHICCGPCSIYPFEALAKEGFGVEGLFYNPNIQPEEEYLKRKEAVKSFEKIFNIKIHFGNYQQKDYFDNIKCPQDKNSRCRSCFKLRLKETHRFAQDNHFDYFTSTLLVSPYQDQKVINDIGKEISLNSSVQFLFYDFRPGFRQAHNKARELNLYCQKYCGCLFSLQEREQGKQRKNSQKCKILN